MPDKSIHPVNDPNEKPVSLFDDPAMAFLGATYRLAIAIFTLQSLNALVFLRHRMGKRVMRSWIFVVTFWLLFWLSMGWVHPPFSDASGIDGALLLYALLMAGLAIYHTCVSRELTDPAIPEHLKLHTRARGDSHLMVLLGNLPRFYLPLKFHFYSGKWWQPLQITPLSEPFVQRFMEPLLLTILGIMFAASGSRLGIWLLMCAISLVYVEIDFQRGAMERLDDLYDQRLEARTLAVVKDRLEQGGHTPRKINGISVTNVARVSQTLIQLQKEAERNQQQTEGNDSAA